MQRFFQIQVLEPFILCFHMIAHPKGPIERDGIGFGANNSETFCSQTTPLGK